MTSATPPHEPQPPAEPSDEDAAKKTNRSSTWIAVAVAAAILICVISAAVHKSRPDPGANERDAERVCQDFVKKRLKAPATADFSGLAVEVTEPEYTVTGDVDAQNSFGAKLRSQFTCVVRVTGDQWTLVSVTGLD